MFDIGAHARPRPPWGSHRNRTRSKIGRPDTVRASLRCQCGGAVGRHRCCWMRKRRSPCSGRERAPPRYDAKGPSRRLTGGAGAHFGITTRSCSALPTGKKSVVVIARKENGRAEGELVERHGKQRCALRGGCQSLTRTKWALMETFEPARPPDAEWRSSAFSPAVASTERTTPRENMSAGRRMIFSPSTL